MKISILLPYKENFSPNYAGAVSLFVKDTTKESVHKKNIFIYGSTNYNKKLTHNYVNLYLKKKFYESGSKLYVNSFLSYEKKNKSNIIEIHNRPNYLKFLRNHTSSKIFLYFHNDPLTMNGSKKILERNYLLENLDKIIFNSNWSKKRFFIGLNIDLMESKKIHVIHQSAPKTKINFNNKKKIISFIGKLNKAKGYDLFGSTIIKVLNKHREWKAVVIGDEPREKLFFKHPRLRILGFKNNDYILNFLKSVSISVVCSRWDEPFGRTSLEASSRGSAVIISNKGGLPETTKNAIILKKLNEGELFKNIENLILNKNLRKKFQISNYKNFKLTHKFVTNLIDKLRNEFLFKPSFNINKNPKLKIIHITNFNERHNGRLHYNTGRRLNNGFIRLGHNILTISDRDILHKTKTINDFKGLKNLNKRIIETYENFKPNLIILGHADGVNKKTLQILKNKDENLKIAQWFLDPLSVNGPDFQKNRNRIMDKHQFVDSSFLTTDPNSLSFEINNSHFMPNPCDHSFETLSNYKSKCDNDLFFAMSHGVHRGELKKGKVDDRELFINKLLKNTKNIKFDIYGMNNIQPIWGEEFINKISNSSMGLNLSRGKPIKYYSSDRIAQLLGNGLLTFVDEKIYFSDFFSNKEIIFYKNISDLSEKIYKYKRDIKLRKKIAKNGKKSYFKHFNSNIVAEYILNKTLDYKSKTKFIWER